MEKYTSQAQLKIKTMLWVLVFGLFLLAIKFIAWYITGSVSIFSDALESIVNILSGIVALFSLRYAAKPSDKDHPYGHGKIEFVSAGFEGALVLVAGFFILFKGFQFIFIPKEIQQLDFGILLIFFAGAINGIMGIFLIKKSKKLHSPVLYASGKHLLTDTFTSVALLITLALIYFTNWKYFDAIGSILMGFWILYTGYSLFINSFKSLMDTVDEQKIQMLIEILENNRKPNWVDIHNLRVLKYGSHLHVDCHVTLPWYFNLEQSHFEVNLIKTMVEEAVSFDIEFFIHSDPCEEFSCGICTKNDCTSRRNEFKEKLVWTSTNLLPNTKHKIIRS